MTWISKGQKLDKIFLKKKIGGFTRPDNKILLFNYC